MYIWFAPWLICATVNIWIVDSIVGPTRVRTYMESMSFSLAKTTGRSDMPRWYSVLGFSWAFSDRQTPAVCSFERWISGASGFWMLRVCGEVLTCMCRS